MFWACALACVDFCPGGDPAYIHTWNCSRKNKQKHNRIYPRGVSNHPAGGRGIGIAVLLLPTAVLSVRQLQSIHRLIQFDLWLLSLGAVARQPHRYRWPEQQTISTVPFVPYSCFSKPLVHVAHVFSTTRLDLIFPPENIHADILHPSRKSDLHYDNRLKTSVGMQTNIFMCKIRSCDSSPESNYAVCNVQLAQIEF